LLSEGDVIRMGRLKYRVNELVFDKSGKVKPINLNDLLLGSGEEDNS